MEGVDLNINTVEWGAFSEVGASGQADIFAMGWLWYPDPYFFFDKMFKSDAIGTLGNGQGYNNPEVDQLLADALIETDQEKRAEIYKKVLKIITNDDTGESCTYNVRSASTQGSCRTTGRRTWT